MIITGRVWTVGDFVDTDVIMPGAYSQLPPAEGARFVLEGLIPGFAARLAPGDILVAGCDFGCGSSRESAPYGLKYAGIAAVVAVSFARIFHRNAFNIGLPVLECPEAGSFQDGDMAEVDFAAARVRNLSRSLSYAARPLPPMLQQLLHHGGMVPYLRVRLAEQSSSPSTTLP